MSHSTARFVPSVRRLVPAVAALSVLAAACGGGASGEPTAVPVPDTTSPSSDGAVMSDGDAMSDAMSGDAIVSEPESDPVVAPAVAVGDETEHLATARQRCMVGFEALERRIEAEGYEWPEEGPELSEEELEQVLTPEYPNVDGVASPDERAPIDLIPAFDPETVPIPELDHLVGACIEGGVVTEGELFGDEDDGDGDWCSELAELDADVIAEFAAEEGEDVVRSEFAECGLPDPLPG